MDLIRLRQIVAVADHGSLSRAAQHVNITQPALSRSIAALETRLGVRLLDRSRNGAVPTAAGLLVVKHARAILEASDNLQQGVTEFRQGRSETLAFGARPMLASVLFPGLCRCMINHGMARRMKTTIASPRELVRQLLNGSIEFCFGNSDEMDMAGLDASPIGHISLSVVVRAGHPLAARTDVSVRDLEAYPVVDSSGRFASFFLAREPDGITCENHNILREVTLGTDSCWISSDALAREDLAAGRMQALSFSDITVPANEISIVRLRSRLLSPGAEVVVKVAAEILAGSDASLTLPRA